MKQTTKEEEELLKQLGARIKELRIKKGFSNYEHFAYENNISRAQYGKYEVGENMKFLTLVRVLSCLGVSLSDFFSEGFEG